jgi:hypothetical protein
MPPKTTPDNRYIIPWPPALWTAPISGKRYAGSGGIQIEVDDDWTLEDVQEFFCWGDEARKYWDSNYSDDVKTIEVKGSKGQKYTVTKRGPKWECQCRGFQFRRDCKHIQNLRILIEG